MEMYRIVFKGELLDGFAMTDVQRVVAERLRLGAEQVTRMFGGQSVVLKKAVTAEAGQPYLAELWRMGMNVWMEPLPSVDDAATSSATFKVVFWGKTLQGYNRTQVMRAAARRLSANQQQTLQLFSGAKAVLKRGVNAELGARYVTTLARIGMQIELEVEAESLTMPNLTASQATATQSAAAASMTTPDDYTFTQLMTTQFDLQRTSVYFNEAAADAAQTPPPVIAPPPAPLRPVAQPTSSARSSTRQDRALASDAVLAAVMAAEKAEPVAQVRCLQCGHRQALARNCAVCGCEMHESLHPVIVAEEHVERSKSRRKKRKNGRDNVSRQHAARRDLPTLMREMIAQSPTIDMNAEPVAKSTLGRKIMFALAVLILCGLVIWKH
ncbi:MAG TPA: hypothetical protein VFW00_07365 [Rhodocyclaceae bacterium]|nr:hypothetical protein [Rhodocyclaceae bacterium]